MAVLWPMSRTATVIEKRFYISSHGTFWKFPPRANDVGQFYFRHFSIDDQACPFWYSNVEISANNDVDPGDKVSLTDIWTTFREVILVPSVDFDKVLLNMQKARAIHQLLVVTWPHAIKERGRKSCSCSQIPCLELQSCPFLSIIWCLM